MDPATIASYLNLGRIIEGNGVYKHIYEIKELSKGGSILYKL